MASLLDPLQLGKLKLPNRILLSPLAGCSDWPYRMMVAKYRPGLMFCEMVKMDALVRYDPHTFHLLDYDKSMHPIGAQLVGGKPKVARKAAQILEQLGFDSIDLNCGCPVDKVTKDGSGSGLLKTPNLIGDILTEMISTVRIPVTVKIRAGWDDEHICASEITQIAEQAGAQAIAIHGRTRKQAYRGQANWDHIKAAKESAKNIIVIGNGDIFDHHAAEAMVKQTGCDAVLVSRGSMGRPWIFEDIREHLKGNPVKERSINECLDALEEHFELTLAYEVPERAIKHIRRVGCWYIKSTSGTRDFRHRMSRVSSTEEVYEIIRSFRQDHCLPD